MKRTCGHVFVGGGGPEDITGDRHFRHDDKTVPSAGGLADVKKNPRPDVCKGVAIVRRELKERNRYGRVHDFLSNPITSEESTFFARSLRLPGENPCYMKRLLLALPVVCCLTTPVFAVTKAPLPPHVAHARAVTAPADEYFGHQKYSILGIRNALHDLNIRYDGSAYRTPFLYANAAGLEDAMHDWDKRYHGDLWLGHYLFQLDQIYMRVPPALGRAKIESLSRWIVASYPHTFYSHYLAQIHEPRPLSVQRVAAVPTPRPSVAASATPASAILPLSKSRLLQAQRRL